LRFVQNPRDFVRNASGTQRQGGQGQGGHEAIPVIRTICRRFCAKWDFKLEE